MSTIKTPITNRVKVAGFHASGLYTASVASVDDVIEALINQKVDGVPVSYGSVTEMYADKFKPAFRDLPDGWAAQRLGKTDAAENILLYDADVWDPVPPSVRAVQLSTQRIFTGKGNPRPFTTAAEAALAHYLGGVMIQQGSHWSLNNTVNRRLSFGLERSTARDRWNDLIEILDAQVSSSFDVNRNLRDPKQRKEYEAIYKGTALRSAWNLDTIQRGPGTHGGRVIDVNLSNMAIASHARVLTGFPNPFDHRPIGFAHYFDTTRGLAPRRVGGRRPGEKLNVPTFS